MKKVSTAATKQSRNISQQGGKRGAPLLSWIFDLGKLGIETDDEAQSGKFSKRSGSASESNILTAMISSNCM
jgi:hypothetical protein